MAAQIAGKRPLGVPRTLLLGAIAAGLLFACQTPALRFTDRAVALGMEREIVTGAGFDHVVFRTAKPSRQQPPLHVYLDHDGTPWQGGQPAADPTPRNDLTLRLMALDPAPALYLGRPCYLGLAAQPGCSPDLWTSRRYSQSVIDSMAAALRRLVDGHGGPPVVLLGYSGGGVLALLLAPRVPEVVAVITVAANLDIDAWADHHHWPRLQGSQNPSGVSLSRRVVQRHYAGGHDDVVPPQLVQRAARAGDTVVVVPDFDHVCCWASLWPQILADVAKALDSGP